MSEWNSETAEWYAEKYGDYPTNRLTVKALVLNDDTTIVDVGCGTGAALRHAATKIKGGKFIGIDPVPRMIEIADELTENHAARDQIEYRVGSAESIPVDEDIADYVFAFDSIAHWSDIDKGLNEIKRILQPDGILAIVTDEGVPGAHKSTEKLLSKLERSSFEILEKQEISKEGVSFLLMICEARK